MTNAAPADALPSPRHDQDATEPSPESRFASAILSWHAKLQAAKGDRSRLRHAQTPDEALELFGAWSLLDALDGIEPKTIGKLGRDEDAVARTAIALSLIRDPRRETKQDDEEDGGVTATDGAAVPRADRSGKAAKPGEVLGKALAVPGGAGTPLTEDRFRLLVSAELPDEFLRLLRGAIHQADIKRAGNNSLLLDTARVVLRWHAPRTRADTRRALFLAFFENMKQKDHVDA